MVNKKLFFGVCLAVVAATFSFSETVNADSLSSALSLRGGFSYNSANSYDGPGRDTLSFFTSYTDGNIYQLGTIASQATAITYSASLISEMACYSGDDPNFQGANTNKFGHQDVGGSFEAAIDSDNLNPVATASFTQEAGKDFNFALKSPDGLFYGKDSLNADGGVAHMLALKVTTAGTINLGESNLFGNGPISFNLEVGDVVLFIEDMLAAGSLNIPLISDFDYNDMVVVLRASAVPEPATLALLGLGVLGGAMRRKRQ